MARRCWFDENSDPRVAPELSGRGCPSQYVVNLSLAFAADPQVLEAAAGFDLLITLDLDRQTAEWQAARSVMRGPA